MRETRTMRSMSSKPRRGRKPVRGEPEQVRIGARVQAEREAADWTREQLAEALDVHVSVVGRIEQGKIALTAYRAKRIAGLLGVTVERLIGDHPAQARCESLTAAAASDG